MPYVTCPDCATTAYTAARFSTRDECPRCWRPLDVCSDARRGGGRPAAEQLAAQQIAEPALVAVG